MTEEQEVQVPAQKEISIDQINGMLSSLSRRNTALTNEAVQLEASLGVVTKVAEEAGKRIAGLEAELAIATEAFKAPEDVVN
jgi:hypothetical protein